MINPSQTIKYYFNCLKANGDKIDFDIYESQHGKILKTYNFDHRDYDGISAFAEISRKQNYHPTFPKLRQLPPPNFFMRMFFFVHWWTLAQFKRVPETLKRSKTKDIFVSSQTQLNPLQQEERKFFAKVLFALHQTFSKENEATLWMIPVALYQDHEMNRDMPPGNQVSFLDLKVTNKKTYKDLNLEIKKGLAIGYHWGTIYSLHVASLLGQNLFLKLFPFFSKRLQRTGTLSNMGVWTIPEFAPDVVLTSRSVVVEMNPVSANFAIINGKLSLCLNFHESYGMTETEAKILIENWQKNILKLLINEETSSQKS